MSLYVERGVDRKFERVRVSKLYKHRSTFQKDILTDRRSHYSDYNSLGFYKLH